MADLWIFNPKKIISGVRIGKNQIVNQLTFLIIFKPPLFKKRFFKIIL